MLFVQRTEEYAHFVFIPMIPILITGGLWVFPLLENKVNYVQLAHIVFMKGWKYSSGLVKQSWVIQNHY
ncbi:hypothetical protein AAY84_13915 [Serratia marcescens]|nr:hypothetical protein AAY84_13915 [Serratia marcescens]